METQKDRRVLAAVCPNQIGRRRRRAAHKVVGPRSSSPVTVCAGLPCALKQAFSTIAWDDLEYSARPDSRDGGAQVNGCDEDQDFGGYALEFIADSPSTLESTLSPGELVPFQGCIIPPLTPRWDMSTEDAGLACPSTDADKSGPGCRAGAPQAPAEVDHGLRDAVHETDELQERNVHLRQLARRAKHLASVLENLMAVTERAQTPAPDDRPPPSPCKRQRLDEGYETESSDSVEDMLRDVSTRCNAVLHGSAPVKQQGSEVIRVRGAFSGLQTRFSKDGGGGAEAEGNAWSFRTSVREHGTIRTQAFPQGQALTTRMQEGGYRFRWVPNHS